METKLDPRIIPGLETRRVRLPLERIEEAVCREMGVTPEQLRIKCRKRETRVLPRQFIYYLARKYTKLSLARMASRYMQDHSTALHAVREVQSKIDVRDEYVRHLHRVENRLVREYWAGEIPTS